MGQKHLETKEDYLRSNEGFWPLSRSLARFSRYSLGLIVLTGDAHLNFGSGFDGMDKNRFSRLLREAYEGTWFIHKSPHFARHTFATNFAGMTNADTGLCRLVIGHKDENTTLGYVHLFAQINRQARAKQLIKTKIDLIS